MKILIIGGHMAPAVATLQQIPKDAEVVYVGRKHPFEGDSGISLEYQVIDKMGIRFVPFEAGRLQRTVTRHSIRAFFKTPMSMKKAIEILKKEKPDIVVGFGGYVSLPIGLAAAFLHIPLVIHEQTLRAGLTNKILSKFAKKVAISWEESSSYFPKEKIELVGNPHLQTKPTTQMMRLVDKTKDLPRLVITGGSGGSHAINAIVEQILPALLEKYHVIHQTGDAKEFGDYDRLDSLKKRLPSEQQARYHMMKFIDPSDFDYLYSNASLVVSRSGINTVTSLLLLGTPALLIPLISGQKNEQSVNAQFLEHIGLAEVVSQKMPAQNIFLHIDSMMQRRKEFEKVNTSIYQELHLHAAQKLVQLLYVVTQVYPQTKS